MKTIQIYTDDTRGVKQTFQVIASIWGQYENCKLYSDDVDAIIISNSRLGTDFKGLHSYNLNADNWTTLGVTFQKVLEKLFEFVTTNRVELIESTKKLKKLLIIVIVVGGLSILFSVLQIFTKFI